ncbi:MAG: hypothetical protein HZA69_02110 [Gammaproteobacteria bacterium]|nr:hypothetical protein [Gammaproteobacteria bacterium]
MIYGANIGRTTVGLLFFLISWPLAAQEEGIVQDPATDDYVITYQGFDYDTGARLWRRVVFVPATKIEPMIKSTFKATDQGMLLYRYKVRNGKTSKQALRGFFTIASHANERSHKSPSGWHGGVNPNYGKTGVIISWFYRRQQAGDGLKPGANQEGFYVESQDLPGIGTLYLRGSTPTLSFPDEGPGQELADKLDELRDLTRNSIPRPAAVPLIPVPSPFDAATVLTSLQKHVKEDLIGMALIDPVLVSQLDPLFGAALDAAQRGNAEGTRKAIKDIRHLLKREHENVDKEDNHDEDDDQDDKKKDKHNKKRLIDKLAAKVLDFDLKYVEKRVKGMLDDSPQPAPTLAPVSPPGVTPGPLPPRKAPGVF